MKRYAAVVALCLCALAAGCAGRNALRTTNATGDLGYRLEGSKVIFEFDPAAFQHATHDVSGEWRELGALAVPSVQVAGEFNGWSKTAWPMHRSGKRWVRSCARTELGTAKSYEFKFVIGHEWWVEPPPASRNQVDIHFMNNARNLVLTLP